MGKYICKSCGHENNIGVVVQDQHGNISAVCPECLEVNEIKYGVCFECEAQTTLTIVGLCTTCQSRYDEEWNN